jgi:hypothetical protein
MTIQKEIKMESVQTGIKIVEKSFETNEEWIARAETLLAKRLIRLQDMGRLNIIIKKS